jgi:outer membrane lipoprotein SlyB
MSAKKLLTICSIAMLGALGACQKGAEVAPTVSISVDPGSVSVGQGTTLKWSSENATSCTATGSWSGTQPTSGSQSLAPDSAGIETYTLLCNGPGGSTASSAALTVKAKVAQAPAAPKVCADCGTIQSITPVKEKGEGSGMGAIAGAIIGGVIGHQFGSGRGNDAATATGAIAGGVTGHQIERRVKGTSYYSVIVQMDGGGVRTVNVSDPTGLTVGAKVRVVGNDIDLRT